MEIIEIECSWSISLSAAIAADHASPYSAVVDVLVRIKRLVVARRVVFTAKAASESLAGGLHVDDVYESILNANAIKKTLRSRSRQRASGREALYVIESPTYMGLWIYTKGVIRREAGREVFYVLISSKLAT